MEDVLQNVPSATVSFAAPKVPVKLVTVAFCSQPTVKPAHSIVGFSTVSAAPVPPLAPVAILAIFSTTQALLAWCSAPVADTASIMSVCPVLMQTAQIATPTEFVSAALTSTIS